MAHILVVDDEELVRFTLRVALEADGHQITTAENGKDALRLVAENTYDLVITDLIMPEKEGIETIIELKRSYPGIKILAISGGGKLKDTSALEIAGYLGARNTLKKPFGRDELLSKVTQSLSESADPGHPG